jgi:alkaline phosphatase
MEDEIATQQVQDSKVDVMIGGGSVHFVPLSHSAAESGYIVATNATQLRAAVAGGAKKVLAHLVPNAFPYYLDRKRINADLPTLSESVTLATRVLAATKKPYVLVVEGSQIDIGMHEHDAAAAAWDAIEFWDAISMTLDEADKDKQTVVLVVADHDTGGLSLGASGSYDLNMHQIAAASMSIGAMADLALSGQVDVATVLSTYAEVASLSASEANMIAAAGSDRAALIAAISAIVSQRTGLSWGTSSHTATNVVTFAYDPRSMTAATASRQLLLPPPVIDNTDIAKLIAKIANLDMSKPPPNNIKATKSHLNTKTHWDRD